MGSKSSGLLPADLGRLLATNEGADVEIEVSGKMFTVQYKTMLAARSPVFKAHFFGPAKEEDTDFVRIDDMPPEGSSRRSCTTCTLTLVAGDDDHEFLAGRGTLIVAADRYGMDGRLKSLAEDKLCNHIDVSTESCCCCCVFGVAPVLQAQEGVLGPRVYLSRRERKGDLGF
ncbi:unnamed protein product [Urochloa humidicola]